MGHLWYLSVDYQLFVIVVVTLALAKQYVISDVIFLIRNIRFAQAFAL